MITVEAFKDFLEENGVNSREAGQSLAIEHCPVCGRNKYKVIFRVVDVSENMPFFGRCQSGSCQQNYSSITYLLKLGVEKSSALHLHGKDGRKSLEELSNTSKKEKIERKEEVKVVENDISEYIDVDENPKHPACKYAVKRGYHKNLKDFIKIDTDTCATVFICRDANGKVSGYQKRFMIPGGGPKTRTSDGFKSSDNLYRLPNYGDYAICEGPFTALSAWHWSFDSIATFGSGAGRKQLNLLWEIYQKNPKPIYVAIENDDAGHKYFRKISNFFKMKGVDVKVIEPEVGDDLNDAWVEGKSYVKKDGPETNPALPDVFGGVI